MTIFSAGCSFSDGWGGATPFGQIIANKFNQDWNRDAVETAGSNDRIFRILTQKILDEEITSEDTILIQYTDSSRREFCSWERPNRPGFRAENWNNDWLVKYFGQEEDHLWTEQDPRFYIDKKDMLRALNDYRIWFDIGNYDFYIFNQRHLHFQTFLQHYNITNVYFLLLNCYCRNTQYDNKPLDFLVKYKDNIYEDRFMGTTDDQCYLPDDRKHMNQNGHSVLADRIYEWMNK